MITTYTGTVLIIIIHSRDNVSCNVKYLQVFGITIKQGGKDECGTDHQRGFT